MNISLNISDFNKICRICLTSQEKMHAIISSVLNDMIKDCVSVLESHQVKMPQKMCDSCFWQLKNAYDFKQKCIWSSEILVEILNQEEKEMYEEDIKCENNEDDKPFSSSLSKVANNNSNKQLVKNEYLKSSNSEKQIYENKIESVENEESTPCNDLSDTCGYNYLENDSLHNLSSEYNSDDHEYEENYTSSDMKEKKRRSLANILIKKYKIYDITCNICNKEFSLRTGLLRHMETHNQNQRKYKCPLCKNNNKLYTAENLKKHTILHTEPPKYECDLCSKRFHVLNRLGKHYQFAHKAKQIQCTKCSAKFHHTLQLEKHEQMHSEKKFICDVCGKEFPIKNYLTKHKKSHSDEKPYICKICKRSFKTKDVLKQHIKLNHTEAERLEVCHICGKVVSYIGFRAHMITHEDYQIKCTKCDKVFKTKTNLKGHMKYKHKQGVVNEVLYYCEICNKALTSRGYLNAHIKKTHSVGKPHKCHLCDKSYKCLSNVRAHIRTAHLDIRPHVCSVCSKPFHTKTLLENHHRTHTGERPFSCSICGKAFGFKNILNTHMKVHSK